LDKAQAAKDAAIKQIAEQSANKVVA